MNKLLISLAIIVVIVVTGYFVLGPEKIKAGAPLNSVLLTGTALQL